MAERPEAPKCGFQARTALAGLRKYRPLGRYFLVIVKFYGDQLHSVAKFEIRDLMPVMSNESSMFLLL